MANGVVYFASEGGIIAAIDAHSGQKIWSYKTLDALIASPVVGKGLVYVAGNEIYALDTSSGQEKWTQPARSGYAFSPALVNGILYVTTVDGDLSAYDALSGYEKWTSSHDKGFTSSPTVIGNLIYVNSFAGISALDKASGAEQWHFDMNGTLAAPAVVNGVVYASSANGANNLYALDAGSGHEQWFYQLGNKNSAVPASTPAVSDGIIYTDALDGRLFALLPPE